MPGLVKGVAQSDLAFTPLHIFLNHNPIRARRNRCAGKDPRRLANPDLQIKGMPRRGLADDLQPRSRLHIRVTHRIPIHGGTREWWLVARGDNRFRQNPPCGLCQPNAFGSHRIHKVEHMRQRGVYRYHVAS